MEGTRLFDKLYDAGTETLKKLSKPLKERSLKRKFQSCFDDATKKMEDAELAINDLQENLDTYDINKILEYKLVIKDCKELKNEIAEEYKTLFGEEIN